MAEQAEASSASSQDQNPQQTLLTLRLLWGAMLGGQLFFLAVVLGIRLSEASAPAAAGEGPGGDPGVDPGRVLFWLSLGLLAVAGPIAHVVRMQIYKKHWRGQAVAPSGYFRGNVLYLAGFESAGLIGSAGLLMSGAMWPAVLPPILALAITAINFPHGKPMQPAGGGD